MSPTGSPRRQYFVDRKVQGALVWRSVLYWFTCLATMTLMLLCWRIMTGPARLFYYHFDDMWFYYGPALVASLVMLPVVVIDIIRLSNRFAGPMVRLRRSMRALARGERVEPVSFRENDFWRDFADEFNAVAALIQGKRESSLVVAGGVASEMASADVNDAESLASPEASGSVTTLDVDETRELESVGAHRAD